MNKIDFAKINKKEDMIMAFNQLKDDYSIAFQQIQELTNNWNELEEWVEKQFNKIMKYEKEKEYNIEYAKCLGDIYYRMKKIKEDNNE